MKQLKSVFEIERNVISKKGINENDSELNQVRKNKTKNKQKTQC